MMDDCSACWVKLPVIVNFPPVFTLKVTLLPKLKLGIVIAVTTLMVTWQDEVPEVGGNAEALQVPVFVQQAPEVNGFPPLGVHALDV
jgi:hypothetical protein